MGIAGCNTKLRWILIAVAALPVWGAAAQEKPTLEQVLGRSAEYVATFHTRLSGIVAEETYLQEIKAGQGRGLPRKLLKSDLLLVRPQGSDRYVEFRDVFEVNGSAVRDRTERLTKLFLSPDITRNEQLRHIIDESARHNVGSIPRNVNTPMLALYFLQADMQRRFRFRRAGRQSPELGSASAMQGADSAVFRATTEMWVVSFRETERPTVIKTVEGHNLPATGHVWLDPATGAILMSELTTRTQDMSAVINVSYQSEPLLGFLVPIEMRERYRSRSERIEGVARYGRFRQFQVKTAETIGKPPGALQ